MEQLVELKHLRKRADQISIEQGDISRDIVKEGPRSDYFYFMIKKIIEEFEDQMNKALQVSSVENEIVIEQQNNISYGVNEKFQIKIEKLLKQKRADEKAFQ